MKYFIAILSFAACVSSLSDTLKKEKDAVTLEVITANGPSQYDVTPTDFILMNGIYILEKQIELEGKDKQDMEKVMALYDSRVKTTVDRIGSDSPDVKVIKKKMVSRMLSAMIQPHVFLPFFVGIFSLAEALKGRTKQ